MEMEKRYFEYRPKCNLQMERKIIEDFHELRHFGVEKMVLTMLQHVWVYDLRTKVPNHNGL